MPRFHCPVPLTWFAMRYHSSCTAGKAAIARGDEAQLGEAEIEHRPRRGADVLAHLCPAQDHGRGRRQRLDPAASGLGRGHGAGARAPSMNSM